MKNLLKTKSMVLTELREHPETRSSDYKLFLAICARKGIDVTQGLDTLILAHKLPSYETITRARRKLQAERPYLKDEETAEYRSEMENLYRDFASINGVQ